MKRKIKFIAKVVKWNDKINGNTYHSCRITRTKDNNVITASFTYGYGDYYKHTTLETLEANKWIKYRTDCLYLYERDNNYPIEWIVSYGTKKECIKNGEFKNDNK